MSRSFGQYCGLARALELVGERWGLLVVRDLVLGPKRFTDLREGLPRIPASILSARLNELEQAGVVRRRILPELDASVVYELTEYGTELRQVVLTLGLWGSRALGDPGEGDVFTMDSAVLSLYTIFRADRARGRRASYELHYGPAMVLHAVIEDGELTVGEGPWPDADLVLRAFGSVKRLFSGETTPSEALAAGVIEIDGDPALLDLLVEMFHIPAAPSPAEGLAVR